MKQKEIFKKRIEQHKTLVLILMLIVLIAGIANILYKRSSHKAPPEANMDITKMIENDTAISNTTKKLELLNVLDMYSEVKALNPEDTATVKKMSKKLDKLIKDEN
jgi:uncharacterized protein YpmB